MTLDKLTIRIYKEPSYLVVVDGHICRYYPNLNQMIHLTEEMESEIYCELEESGYGQRIAEWLDNHAILSLASFVVDVNGKFYRYYPTDEEITLADSLPPQNCPFYTINWTELPESIRKTYVLGNYPDANLEMYYNLVYGKEK